MPTVTDPEAPCPALLPAGMMDLLPPIAAAEAAAVETLVHVFGSHGYERVKPPLLEFEATLLSGSGRALAPQTFRLMDPQAQEMLALRPDMTMQIARIAATRLKHWPRPLRLAYAGQVVRVRGSQVRPERQFGQVGAELIGAPHVAADIEVVLTAAEALQTIGIDDLTVDLGLPGLVPLLLAERTLSPAAAARLAAALERKDARAVSDLAALLGRDTAALLGVLLAACGPAEAAVERLTAARLPPAAASAVETLFAVIKGIGDAAPALTVSVDTVERRGFEYHTGVTFALFSRRVTGELGRGGRYRTMLEEEATGVTLFMDTVLRALPPPGGLRRLFVPWGSDPAVASRLRREGWVTVAALDAGADAAAEAGRLGCSHVLVDDEPQPVTAAAAASEAQHP
jgi:ATP phosphoribosyltransferase regulatory subunit